MGTVISVILCGGNGTRLWPLSQPERPKQFLNLLHPNQSLLQKTAERAKFLTAPYEAPIIVVTHQSHETLVSSQLGDFAPRIITETTCRNTAPAIAKAAEYIQSHFSPDHLMFVMPCDAHIENVGHLKDSMGLAIEEAQNNKIALFGVKPHRPETGYGYIERRPRTPFGVRRFVEKPTHEKALAYIQSGNYLWNSGMAIFKASVVLNEFKLFAPSVLDHNENTPSTSFDVAILEKTHNLSVIPCDLQWSDVGTWNGLWEILKDRKSADNYIDGVSIYDLVKSKI